MVRILSRQKIVPVNWLRKPESRAKDPVCLVFLSLAELFPFYGWGMICEWLWESHWGSKVRLGKPVWLQTILQSNLLSTKCFEESEDVHGTGSPEYVIHQKVHDALVLGIGGSGTFPCGCLCCRNSSGQRWAVVTVDRAWVRSSCEPWASWAVSLHLMNFHPLLLWILIFLS